MVGTNLHGNDRSICRRHLLGIQIRTEWIVADGKVCSEHEQPRQIGQQAHVPALIYSTLLHEHNR